MTMPDSAPLLHTITALVPTTALAVDSEHNVASAPFDGSINLVAYLPDATITGVDTNTRLVQLVNKGQNGVGTVVVATKTFNAGTNAPGDDETAITLSATPTALVVQAGDVLAWQSTHLGTGLADPGGLVKIQFIRG